MNFLRTFYHTLTTPGEWHGVSILAVGLGFIFTLAVLAGAAFDAQF